MTLVKKVALTLYILFLFTISTAIFFLPHIFIAPYAVFTLLYMLTLRFVFKRNMSTVIQNATALIPFFILAVLFNMFFIDWQIAMLNALRIVVIGIFSFAFAASISTLNIATGIEGLLFPLRLIGIRTAKVSLLIAISVTFVPILRQELKNISDAINLKGRRRWTAYIKLKVITYQIFYRASILGDTLNTKGYK
ncbi:MAG: energy-coupling factor transporter transmembrane protein EcfT [Firmicutes bacterium]|nr:energy-coupling factor transporter transmembrane protein EcfT [Bacillota bacterium]